MDKLNKCKKEEDRKMKEKIKDVQIISQQQLQN